MPTSGNPLRHTAVASKAIVHGQLVLEENFIGNAFKAEQVDRWTLPADAQKIAQGEEYELQLGDIGEAPLAGPLADVDVGDKVWIVKATNALAVAAGSTGTTVPVGIVTEIDASVAPARVLINKTALHAFFA